MIQLLKHTPLFFLILLLMPSLMWAQDISIDEIVKKANHVSYYNGTDGRAKVSMIIKDKQGRKRKRSFVILRKNTEVDKDGEQKFYVYFTRPSDLKKMVFLVFKKNQGDDDRWMYIPSLDLVKRIAGGDKRTSFVGSSFFYEDVSGRKLSADKHVLKGTTDKHYLVESTPVNAQEVKFTKYIATIDKKSFIPLKIEYYNSKGKVYRIYETEKWEVIQGHPTAMLSSMKDLETGVETYNKYSKVQYDLGMKEEYFSERYLRKAPTDLIKF